MKVQRIRIFFFSLLCGFLPGCWNTEQQPTVRIINILDKKFYDDCHIPGSLRVSLVDLKKQAESWPKTTKIIVYCSNYSCTASTMAVRTLLKMGFNKVWDYEAGMAGWYQSKLPFDGPAKESYLTQDNKPLSLPSTEDVPSMTTEQLHTFLKNHDVIPLK